MGGSQSQAEGRYQDISGGGVRQAVHVKAGVIQDDGRTEVERSLQTNVRVFREHREKLWR